ILVPAVAVAVAAVPEGLVVIMTVILAIGMQRILRQGSLVRKLVAAETLGSTTVICTDKTGTLTEGIMRVVKVVTHDRHTDMGPASQVQESKSFAGSPSYFLALRIGMIGSNAFIENPEARFEHRVIIGTPTEQALVHAASQASINQEALKKEFPRLEELPFDSEKKYMVTLNEDTRHHRILFIKGAPEIILDKASKLEVDGKELELRLSRRGKLTEEYKELSRQGLRLLAVGYKKVDKGYEKINQQDDLVDGMTIVGFMAMKDPLREDTRQTIELCQEAGIRPVMITGDHRLTAMAIAQELGLPSKEENVIEGAQFEKLNSKELKKQVEKISVYARVNPQDKLRIVNALQSRGEVVAMTGDGVNDAPALKTADIGLALGSGTDVAKDTADIVLLDNHFKTIVRAVEEGRIIFNNIKKVILYLMSDSFTEIIIIGTSLFIGIIGTGSFPLPLLATQILWINLITDGFPNIALTLEPADRDVMKDKPVPLNQPIVTSHMWSLVAIVSLVTGIATLILFTIIYRTTGDIDLARTVAFTAVAIDSLLYVFSIRSMRKPIWNKNFFTNPYLLVAVALGFGLQLLAIYMPFFQRIFHTVPLTLGHWFDLLLVSLAAIVAIEISKMVFNRVKKHRGD
ncbi:cation-translocating P-type ATPase, partial [Patescibacteria group bacterium]